MPPLRAAGDTYVNLALPKGKEMEQEGSRESITRRRILKRFGAGAAIAWSAPVISSLQAPAFAQYPPACGPVRCATPNDPCPSNPACRCSPAHDGSGPVCWTLPALCFHDGEVCNQDSDCIPFGGPAARCLQLDCPEACGTATTACAGPCPGGPAPSRPGVKRSGAEVRAVR
jgi:hypothetical protein